MNREQITGIIRIIIPAICGWLGTAGFSALGDSNFVAAVTTVIITLGSVAWSIFSHTAAAKLESAAEVDPGIKIQVPPRVMAENPGIHALVRDDNVPNVTSTLTPTKK